MAKHRFRNILASLGALGLALNPLLGISCAQHGAPDEALGVLQLDDPAVALVQTHGVEDDYRIIEQRVENERLVLGDRIKEGHFSVSVRGKAPHKIRFQTRQTLTRGAGDTVVEIQDETDGTTSKFTLSDDGASVHAETQTGSLQILANPDGSYSVDGQSFANASAAAQFISQSEASKAVSPEVAAVLSDMCAGNGILDGTARWAAVVAVVVVVWIVASDVVCSFEFTDCGCIYGSSCMSQYCSDWCSSVGCWCTFF